MTVHIVLLVSSSIIKMSPEEVSLDEAWSLPVFVREGFDGRVSEAIDRTTSERMRASLRTSRGDSRWRADSNDRLRVQNASNWLFSRSQRQTLPEALLYRLWFDSVLVKAHQRRRPAVSLMSSMVNSVDLDETRSRVHRRENFDWAATGCASPSSASQVMEYVGRTLVWTSLTFD